MVERRTEGTYENDGGRGDGEGATPRRVVKKVVRPEGGRVGERNPGNLNSARLTEREDESEEREGDRMDRPPHGAVSPKEL